MNLGIEDFVWSDLTDSKRLADLAIAFDRFVEARDAALFARFPDADALAHALDGASDIFSF